MVALVSHRTNAGDSPENTLPGIEAAIRDGCRAIEVDVRATRDGALVLMHDETLERTTGDPRRVSDVTLDEVRRLRVLNPGGSLAAATIPTLEEAIDAIRGRAIIEVDFVDYELTDTLIDLVNASGAAPWTWWTPHLPEVARRQRDGCPGSRVYLGISRDDGIFRNLFEAIDVAAGLGIAGINPSHRLLDVATVEAAHTRGLEVACWTLNDEAATERVLRLGVDLVTTDYPRMVADVAARLGVPLDR
jgi:glycerophosphoryl diester phosphodiesterase